MKTMSCILLVASLAAPAAAAESTTKPRAFTPTGQYARRNIEGWTFYIHPEMTEKHPKLLSDVLTEASCQLRRIRQVIPADKVRILQTVPIWVEYRRVNVATPFHPSRRWLENHGLNGDKAGSVEIANSPNFLAWSKHDQPWILLHELAHGLHWKLFRFNQPEIKAAWEAAKAEGKLDKVLHVKGKTVSHYALTNEKEFFAEMTEAYFGRNDMHPFIRAELKQDFPKIAKVIHEVWYRPVKFTPTAEYIRRNVEGWTVLIHPLLPGEHAEVFKEAMAELRAQLYRIRRLVPADKVAVLQRTRIWLEYEGVHASAAMFHPYVQWLTDNGMNPDKHECIELADARKFVAWSRSGLPWMVFHEMSHAYDWTMWRYQNPKIIAAWKKFVAEGDRTGRLREVLHFNGATFRHNGRTTQMEFFAEFSETWFGRNEMYPFVRGQLQAEAPEIAKLIHDIWHGPVPSPTTRPTLPVPPATQPKQPTSN